MPTLEIKTGPRIFYQFPGQATQESGMGLAVIGESEVARHEFELGTQALAAANVEIDLLELTNTSDEQLRETLYTQLAVYATSRAALVRLNEELGIRPDYVAGHSIGEFAAYTAAGILKPDEAIKLVHKRGSLMSKPQKPGGLGVVMRLADEQVEEIAKANGAYLAGYNSDSQTTVSGTHDALTAVKEDVEQNTRGRYFPVKNVSVPVHCILQAEANWGMIESLAGENPFQAPEHGIRLAINFTGDFEKEPWKITASVPVQIVSPIRWKQSVEVITNPEESKTDPHAPRDQRLIIVEVGYGSTLTGFGRDNKNPNVRYATFEQALETKLDWDALAA